jgi:hypothetical protein
MAKTANKSNKTTIKRGKRIGTSNNVSVEGVLNKNVATRNKLINMKEKYSQYEEVLAPAIGEYYQISTRDVKSLTDNKGLSAYSYDGNSDYSAYLLSKYFYYKTVDDTIVPYSVDDTTAANFARWGGNYTDYQKYISDLFSNQDVTYTFANGVLANVRTEYALREMEVGVVTDLRVADALNGEITTNPDGYKRSLTNLSTAIMNGINFVTGQDYTGIQSSRGSESLISQASDTRLGMITSQLYSQTLYNGATFNSTKNRGVLASGHAYITPSLASEYGNSLSTIFKLSDIARVNNTTGRINDDFGSGIKIIELDEVGKSVNSSGKTVYDYNTMNETFKDNSQILILNEMMSLTTQQEAIANSHTANKSENALENRAYYNPAHQYDTSESEVVNERENKKIAARIKHEMYQDYNTTTVTTDENGDIDSSTYDDALSSLNEQFDAYGSVAINGNKLLNKTNRLFANRKIATMVGAFCTGTNGAYKAQNNTIDTQWHDTWGRGKGRTLLTLNAQDKNNAEKDELGFENPYCRSWAYHHQYSRYKDSIRPFIEKDSEGSQFVNDIRVDEGVLKFRSTFSEGESYKNGGQYLVENSVLQSNGLVKITPTVQDKEVRNNVVDGLKKCMFSIENLAWKDFNIGKTGERGPNGGRMMWFPPYDLDFQENVNVDWGSNSFIGRGEKVYTYANTDRTAQLSFTMLIDHPSVVNLIGNSEGQGEQNKDIDADILRFFAGCQPLKFTKKEKIVEKTPEPAKIPVEVTPEGSTLKFAVFFLNNYSGNYNIIEKNEWAIKGCSDVDYWWKYLLFGQNVDYVSGGNSRGYEMGEFAYNGISDKNLSFDWARNYSNEHGGEWDYGNDFPESDKSEGKVHKYFFRTDFDFRQNYLNEGNYEDNTSFGLNSSLSSVEGKYEVNYSFAEVFGAMYDADLSYAQKEYLVRCGADQSRIDKLKELFKNQGFKITKIKVEGSASKQDPTRSDLLADRRAKCVGITLKNKFNFSGEYKETGDYTPCGGDIRHIKDNNLEVVKAQKCAVVTITYNSPTIENNGNVNDEQPTESDNTSSNTYSYTNEDGITYRSSYSSENGGSNGTTLNNVNVYGDYTGIDEYQYFNDLKITDPYIWKSIKDKYKYFDPAFHSITPEGFNGRLNFLQQCTRQGHTVSASDLATNSIIAPTAGNLSFGRMPVCVLRIGDFIYTRMIIQSLNITYSSDGMQWDLNPEGAGVQPMYAKVSMGLVLIGGQALNGPVTRLQNANTFNYYANTGVHDVRADRIKTDENGQIIYENMYTPN